MALGRLAGRASHEVNNALNGAAMNVEVLRLRAVAGRDAGTLAAFAAAAGEEQDAGARMTGALLALARTPRETDADVRAVAGHVVRLLAPVVRHQGVTVELALDDGSSRTSAPALAVRLAVVAALEAGSTAVAAGAAGDHSGLLRCRVVVAHAPILTVAPAFGAWPDDVLGVLEPWGVLVEPSGDGLCVVFPTP